MSRLSLIIIFGVIAFETQKIMVTGEEKQRSCRSVVQDLTKMQLGGIATCTKSMKFKNGKEKSKKMNCILRCVMMNVGILTPEGQVEAEKTESFLREYFPEHLLDHANRTFTPCMDMGAKAKFKTLEEDEYCGTYDGFVKCLLGNLPTLCPN